jgi:hypothetical protein
MERGTPHTLWLPGSSVPAVRQDYGNAVRRRYEKLGANDPSRFDRDLTTNLDPQLPVHQLRLNWMEFTG